MPASLAVEPPVIRLSSVQPPLKGDIVSSKKIWFITGAGRGMGVDFAKATLAVAVDRITAIAVAKEVFDNRGIQ